MSDANDAKTDGQKKLKYLAVQGGQVYRHYKGGLYVVIATALEEATLEPVVVYRSCARGTIWTRLYADFTFKIPTGAVSQDGVAFTIPRFELLE